MSTLAPNPTKWIKNVPLAIENLTILAKIALFLSNMGFCEKLATEILSPGEALNVIYNLFPLMNISVT